MVTKGKKDSKIFPKEFYTLFFYFPLFSSIMSYNVLTSKYAFKTFTFIQPIQFLKINPWIISK